MKKRFLSLLLTAIILIVLISIFAVTSLATEPENEESEITYVSSWSEIINAVNQDKTYIKLATSITDEVPDDELPTKHRLLFDGGEDYVLDLGPYMLYVRNTSNEFYTDNFSMIGVTNGSKLTMIGGNVKFENYYANSRSSKGVVSVSDTSTLIVEGTNIQNLQTGPVIYLGDIASAALNGGEYSVQNGFALYMTGSSSLTLDGGVYAHTVMGDCAETTFNNGYGALYSESDGELKIEYAFFESGVQIHESQIGVFDPATHEIVINGKQITEEILVSSYHEAKENNKEYYWYDFHMRSLFKVGTECSSFVNKIRVISYDKKSPINVVNGTATVAGVPVTEASYGQEITITADAPEAGKEFVRWDVSGGGVDYPYDPTTTLTMAPNAMKITACYGNASITEIDITVATPESGKTPAMIATANNHSEFVSMEWYIVGHGSVLGEKDIFYPGFDYGVYVLLYPDDDYKFANTVAVTVNGENATVSNSSAGHVLIRYEFASLPQNPFNVSYKSNYQNGVDGQIELNIDSMKSASSEFRAALDADKVSYQWYRNGEIIEGATDSSYTFVSDDVNSYIHCVVSADELVAYGYSVMCTKALYKVNFSLTEIAAGGRAPELTSATQGIAVNSSSYVICEKYSENSFGNVLDISQMVLIPGKTYRIVAVYMITDYEVNVGSNASFYVNGNNAEKDGDRIIYDFTIPSADFDLNVTCEDEIGIGAELVADEITGATYQWYRNGEPITGATSRSYIVAPTDRVSLIHCVATKENGDYGCSSQYVISHYITVIRLSGPTPKNSMLVGQVTSTKFSATASKVNVMWWLGTAYDVAKNGSANSVDLQNDYSFIEGTNYALFAVFVANDTYALHDDAVAYYNGIKGLEYNNSIFVFDVIAIHAHVYDDNVWAHDGEYHWHPCILSGCSNPDEEEQDIMFHYGPKATCQTKGECIACGYEYYGEHDTAVQNYVYIDDMMCGSYCATEGCDYLSEWSYHTGGTSDCQNKAICEICHSEYGKFGDHIAESEWLSDGEYHWHECKNCDGQQLDKESHTGNATCIAKAVCGVCGTEHGDFAEHAEYSQTWDYKDANGHAHVCTLVGCNACDEIVPHTPGPAATENDPQICTDCGYIIEPATGHITHTPKAEWVSDGTYHWHECIGCEGQQLNKAAHAGGTATCTTKAICSVCNTAYGDKLNHNYSIVNGYRGQDGHANSCSCGAHDTPTAHIPDRQAPTENDSISCSVCGYIIEPAMGHITHTPKAEWVSDGIYHWHECTGCEGQQLEKAAHTGGTATCTAKAICTVCETTYGNTVAHNHGAEWQKNTDDHWNECACGDKVNKAAHADENSNGACDVCGQTISVYHTHNYGTTWKFNENNHYKECECGDVSENAAHADDNGDNKCDTCDYVMPAHDPDAPGQPDDPNDPVTTPPEDNPPANAEDGLGTGAIIGIVCASVAVGGIGGFSLFWFAIKKKTLADLISVFRKKKH